MRLFLLSMMTTVVVSQMTTVDPSVLDFIFTSPSPGPETVTTSPRLEDITVHPTDSTHVLIDKNGEECKCVPYYLCDTNDVAVDANNASVTGAFVIDIRFGEERCQESTERCCTSPNTKPEVVTPPPILTPLRGCGYRNPNGIDFTITGGTGAEAQFGEFPWVVAILDTRNDTYAGVGTLIHPQVVMTAAHIAYKVVQQRHRLELLKEMKAALDAVIDPALEATGEFHALKYSPGLLKIRAGEWDTQTVTERLKYQERTVDEIYIHKDFKEKSLKFDMALLRLSEPVPLGGHINVACMPSQDESFDNYKGCIVNGWGKDVFGLQGRYAVILKKVELNMVPNARCNTLLKRTRLGNNFKLHSSFVCAGGEEGKDVCQGDGGAPLTCPIGDDRYKLTGLVAWGVGCGQKDVPAAYAAVANFRQWTDAKMAEWGFDTSGYSI